MSDASAELLAETRRLLNALNEENADLKNLNHRLGTELRETQEAFESAQHQLVTTERDLKQMNFNLMHQLKEKHQVVKQLEQQVEQLEGTVSSLRRTAAEIETEVTDVKGGKLALNEKLRLTEEKNKALQDDCEKQRSEISRLNDEMKTALSGLRERGIHQQSESNVIVAQLQSELEALKDSVAQRELRAVEAESQLAAARQGFAEERGKLLVDAQRTAHMESEAHFAHEQMYSTAVLIHQHLGDFEQKVQVASGMCEQNEATLNSLVLRCEEHKALFKTLRNCDDTILRTTTESAKQLERRVVELRREVESLKDSLRGAEKRNGELERAARDHDSQVQEFARQMHSVQADASDTKQQHAVLTATLAHTQQELREASDAISVLHLQQSEAQSHAKLAEERSHSVEAQFTKERGDHASQVASLNGLLQRAQTQLVTEREQWFSKQQKYEDEIASLRNELQEHTSELSNALGRLTRQLGPRQESARKIWSVGPGSVVEPSPRPAVDSSHSPGNLQDHLVAARRRLQS